MADCEAALNPQTETESPRLLFVYPTDGGEVACIRYDDWKVLYREQNAKGFDIWRDPLVTCAHQSCSTCDVIPSSASTPIRTTTIVGGR